MSTDKSDTIIEFCPQCDEETEHEVVEDDVFDTAIQCNECESVWEADPSVIHERESE